MRYLLALSLVALCGCGSQDGLPNGNKKLPLKRFVQGREIHIGNGHVNMHVIIDTETNIEYIVAGEGSERILLGSRELKKDAVEK